MFRLDCISTAPHTIAIVCCYTQSLPTGYTNLTAGHLWESGYSDGDLKTPLFHDVIPILEAWKKAGKSLVIFSSGSVQAQLQFFSYVEDGSSIRNLKPLFSAHFDTVNAGSKLEKGSYEKICAEIGKDIAKVTFLTDNEKGECQSFLSTSSPSQLLFAQPLHIAIRLRLPIIYDRARRFSQIYLQILSAMSDHIYGIEGSNIRLDGCCTILLSETSPEDYARAQLPSDSPTTLSIHFS